MASDTEIVNLALVKLGQNPITDLHDDNAVARAALAIYNIVRDSELGAHNWKFATRRRALTYLDDTPAFGYKYAFQLPDDCLQLVVGLFGSISGGYDIFPGPDFDNYTNGMGADYAIENNQLLTNDPGPIKVVYIARVTDTSQFASTFVTAFACQLALQLCEKLTQSNTKKQLLAQEYKAAISIAITNDAIQNPPQPLADDTWVLARV